MKDGERRVLVANTPFCFPLKKLKKKLMKINRDQWEDITEKYLNKKYLYTKLEFKF